MPTTIGGAVLQEGTKVEFEVVEERRAPRPAA